MKEKKIALIGNMNNNHFAMMRYFHDLGVEAYLFKYANEFSHFQPECDTHEYEKWAPFIIQTEIRNGDYRQFLKLKAAKLLEIFSGYDYYIGNGFAPVYFAKAGLKLDLFLPYGTGIEFTYRFKQSNFIETLKKKLISQLQIRSIKSSVKLTGTVDSYTFNRCTEFNVPVEKIAMPMVYTNISNVENGLAVSEFFSSQVQKGDFTIFSHVSHLHSSNPYFLVKRNDILVSSFAKYIEQNPSHSSKLILLEYGDPTERKQQIADLGIESKVVWLPMMLRKEIMTVIDHIDLGASEFGGYVWGGTGWEFLSRGKLFFQFVDLDYQQLEDMIKMPPPKFINSCDVKLIADKMAYYYNNRGELKVQSDGIKAWFDENAGIGLARKHIQLLKQID